ncbi:MAG: Gfo/Idh/MocA family oxidoreductase [Acidobacteria bacterium]|nr:Gfo/Idh/MocA family oxidoreductase [Acidobacteriota bacterium]
MERRTFARVVCATPSLLAADRLKRIQVAVLTHAGGAHLSSYFPALAGTEEVESVVLSDPGGENVPAARKALGQKLAGVYEDPAGLLRKEQPAMALVTMEAALAPPAIHAALDAGCHVMAEKPACVRLEDFEPLKRKAERSNRHLMLALANRLDPAMREARRLISAGQIGKIYGVEMHLIADQTRLTRPAYHQSWFARKARAGGGHLIWLGIHWLDLAMHLTGSRVREVAGFAGVVGGQPLDVEDSAVVAMKFDNGVFGALTSGYYLDRGYHSHIKVWGSQGWLHLQKHGDGPLQWYSTKEAKPQVRRLPPSNQPSGYGPFVRAAVRASAGLEDPPLTGDDSLYVLRTVFACYRAAGTGKTQTV